MTTHTEAALRGDLELLNRTVAELVGWTPHGNDRSSNMWWRPNERHKLFERTTLLPRFVNSIDACRTFEAGLTEDEQDKYQAILKRIAHHKRRYIWKLDPPDHCIALCYIRNVITPTTPQ